MLSIISINLNNADGLERTIESILGQIFQDLELIVIDGGSSDGSWDVLKKYSRKIDYWVSERDDGIYPAMNKGLGKAKGDFVLFLNSGDWLSSPGALQKVFFKQEYSESILIGDYYRVPSQEGKELELVPQRSIITLANFFKSGICHQSLFFKKDLFSLLGGYDEQFRIAADWDFTIRALLKGYTIRNLGFPVVCYAGGGISTTMIEERELEKEIMWKKLLSPAVLHDYHRLLFLEGECCRLRDFEAWTQEIKERNVLLNYMMATKWLLKKWVGRLMPGRK